MADSLKQSVSEPLPKIVVSGGISEGVHLTEEQEAENIEKEKKVVARNVKRKIREEVNRMATEAARQAMQAKESQLKQHEVVVVKNEPIKPEPVELLPQQPVDPVKEANLGAEQTKPAALPMVLVPRPPQGMKWALLRPDQEILSGEDEIKFALLCVGAGIIIGIGGYRFICNLYDAVKSKPAKMIVEDVLSSVESLADVKQ